MKLVEMLKSELPEYSTKISSSDLNMCFRPFLVKEEKTLLLISEDGTFVEIIRTIKNILESCYNNKVLTLRSPEATRPWQHVIEPLTGYLLLAEKLYEKNGKYFSEPWNFGPSLKQNMKVKNLVNLFKKKLGSKSKILINKKNKKFHNKKINIFESKHLNINSKKTHKKLLWKPKLSIEDSVQMTVDWYKAFKSRKNLFELTKNQIITYLNFK